MSELIIAFLVLVFLFLFGKYGFGLFFNIVSREFDKSTTKKLKAYYELKDNGADVKLEDFLR